MTGHRSLLTVLLASWGLASCGSNGPRDVVPDSRDVRVTSQDAGVPANPDAYVHIAKRRHGVVALAEARQMSEADAKALVDRWADDLERCATGLEAAGTLVEGAARIVAVGGPDGTPALNVKLAPGDAVAQNALLCLIAPVRASTLPAAKMGAAPGLAIEATWGPPRMAPPP